MADEYFDPVRDVIMRAKNEVYDFRTGAPIPREILRLPSSDPRYVMKQFRKNRKVYVPVSLETKKAETEQEALERRLMRRQDVRLPVSPRQEYPLLDYPVDPQSPRIQADILRNQALSADLQTQQIEDILSGGPASRRLVPLMPYTTSTGEDFTSEYWDTRLGARAMGSEPPVPAPAPRARARARIDPSMSFAPTEADDDFTSEFWGTGLSFYGKGMRRRISRFR
jgi:hypothetical protein